MALLDEVRLEDDRLAAPDQVCERIPLGRRQAIGVEPCTGKAGIDGVGDVVRRIEGRVGRVGCPSRRAHDDGLLVDPGQRGSA
jgi:hypothetical protein